MEGTTAVNAVPESTLQQELHAATRSHHTILNQNIISRFSLGFPPHASSPEAYQAGIIVFGEIFCAFEETADSLISTSALSPRQRQILESLRIPSLQRSKRLTRDTNLLQQRLSQAESPCKVKAHAAAVTASIRRNISEKPHKILAYAWTMYLALFNGGRYMLRQLEKAGPQFWREDCESADGRLQVLSFWYFDSTVPGARDIQDEFKTKFGEVAETLTEEERREVVEESKAVFDLCLEIVLWLDGYCAQNIHAEQPEDANVARASRL